MVWLYKLPNTCIALLFGVIGTALFVGVLFLRAKLLPIQVQSDHAKAAHDGTQRGANDLYQEARNRGHALSVVGVPKTIDNDVGFVSRTFGFFTAVEEAVRVLDCAHTESRSVPGGIGLVKLMGRTRASLPPMRSSRARM
jgi:hypothetical protein